MPSRIRNCTSTPASMSGSFDAVRVDSDSRKRCRRCPTSSIACTDQRWSEEWVEGEFLSTYKDLIFQGILKELAMRVPPGSRRLLDVGAHAGRFLHLAQGQGWQVEGIELNPRTAVYAAVRTGALVHRVNAHTLALAGHRYAAVVLTDVLEHIPEPVRLLSALSALLEPGGVVAVKVPNGAAQWTKERWLARLTSHRISLADNLVHVNQFNPRSLTRALERAGLSRVHVRTAAPELPPAANLRGFLDRAIRRGLLLRARCPARFRHRWRCTSRRTLKQGMPAHDAGGRGPRTVLGGRLRGLRRPPPRDERNDRGG